MSEYTQASLLIFRPALDLLDELRKNRALYLPEANDPWVTLYNINDSLRVNIVRAKSKIEQHTQKRIGDHPVINAAIMLGAQWLSQEKDIDPLLEIRRHFHGIDRDINRLIANTINSIFETFPITLEQGKKQTVKMPINIQRTVATLSEDIGTSINNICTISMMRTFSLLPETIYESSQDMGNKVDEFKELCKLRYRIMKAILGEFEL